MFSHGSHTPKTKAHIEIIPENKFVVFNGDEHNASPAKLRGVVRLTTPESQNLKSVKIRLEGKRRIAWFFMGGMSAGEVSDKRVFYNDSIQLGTPGTHKINKGVIEWPFEFDLNPAMPESVEGMANSWLVYNLHASVERPGWNQKDLISSMHIRVIRTLGTEQMESTRSRTNADIWANKISYSISIPTDAVVFGTSIVADVELSPIRKGVTLGKIDMRLIEQTTKRIQASENTQLTQDRSKTDEAEVAKAEMDFPEDSRVLFDEETPDNPRMEDEKYIFKARLPLPKSLKECRQDVDLHAINITHRFKLMVNIHNPEGHISQLVCRLPVKLFISPNLPIDDSNQVQISATSLSDTQLNEQEAQQNAPPEYGRHQLDELYSDIQPSGFMSRAPSGSATPAFTMSRRGSSEGLQNLGALADVPQGQVSSAALQARLANLQSQRTFGHGQHGHGHGHHGHGSAHGHGYGTSLPHSRPGLSHSPSGNNTPHNGLNDYDSILRATPPSNHGGYFHPQHYSNPSSPPHQSPHGSMPQSRRGSTDGATTPEMHIDMDTLSRVPSYGAAVRTPGPITPFNDGPPSYFEATSRPPSPGAGGLTPSRPNAAHFRTRSSPHSPGGSSVSTHAIGSPPHSGLHPLAAIAGSPSVGQNGFDGPHRASITAEDQARLNILRGRG